MSMAETFGTARPKSLLLLCGKTFAVGLVVALIWGTKLSGFEQTAAGDDAPKLAPGPDQEDVPRIVPKEPDESVRTFHAPNGFRMDLIAHEPLVTSPVAMTYDEN